MGNELSILDCIIIQKDQMPVPWTDKQDQPGLLKNFLAFLSLFGYSSNWALTVVQMYFLSDLALKDIYVIC